MVSDPIDLKNPKYGYVKIFGDNKDVPYIIAVTNKKDRPIIYGYDTKYISYDSFENMIDKYWMYLHLDRYRYLPNDNISVFGVAIKRVDNAPADDVSVKLYKTDYIKGEYVEHIVDQKDVNLSSNGNYATNFELKNFDIGNYVIKVYSGDLLIDQSSVSVSQFKKPKYVIELTTDKDRMFIEDTAIATVKTSFYEGSPVNNMKFIYQYYVDYQNKKNGVLQTDENGLATLEIGSNSQKSSWRPDYLNLRISNNEADETNIYRNVNIMVFPKKTMVTVKANSEEKTGNVIINTNLIDIEKDDYKGETVDTSLNIAVKEIYYERREVGEEYDYINKIVKKKYEYDKKERITQMFKSETVNGEYIFDVEMADNKNYEITVTANDIDGSSIVEKQYISNYYINYFEYKYYELRVDADEEYDYKFKVGEDVKLKVVDESDNTVVSGKTLFLNITEEIDTYEINRDNKYSYKYEQENILNNYIKAIYFDGVSYQYIEGQWINYDYSDEELNIEITGNKDYYKPGEQAELNLNIKDVEDKPVEADLNVIIMDKKMYDIAGNNPIILSSLYRSSYDSKIINEKKPTDDNRVNGFGAEKGGEADEAYSLERTSVRSEFKNIALVKTIKTDASGNGSVSLKLPDDITSWYIICQGVTIDLKAGSATKEIFTTMPMFVDVIFNNFFMTGDSTSIALRSYGDDINLEENVEYTVEVIKEGSYSVEDYISFVLTDEERKALEQGDNTIVATAEQRKALEQGDNIIVATAEQGENSEDEEVIEEGDSSKKYKGSGKSFELTNVDIETLDQGKYKILVTAKQGEYSDVVQLEFQVLDSFLKVDRSDKYLVSEKMNIEGTEGQHTVFLYNKLIGQYRELAYNLLFKSYGNRVDQVISKEIVLKNFSEIFGFTYLENSENQLHTYQNNGGISLFSYDNPTVELTAKMAAFAKEYFNEEEMKAYFEKKLLERTVTSTDIAYSLWGLAELGEPVLIDIQDYATNIDKLNAEEIIVLGNAYATVGDKMNAKKMYDLARADYSKADGKYIYIENKSEEQSLNQTGLMTILGAKLNVTEKDKLVSYLYTRESDKILVNLDMLIYLNETAIRNIDSEIIESINSKATMTYGNKTEKIDITNKEFFSALLSSSELESLKFADIEGEIELFVQYKGDTDGIEKTNDFSFEVKYDEDATEQSDETIVTVSPKFSRQAFSGMYEITVPIPAGYIFQERKYNDSIDSYWYGYTDDLLNYHIVFYYNELKNKYPRTMQYSLRAVLPGEYDTDNAVMLNSDRSLKYEVKGTRVKIVE